MKHLRYTLLAGAACAIVSAEPAVAQQPSLPAPPATTPPQRIGDGTTAADAERATDEQTLTEPSATPRDKEIVVVGSQIKGSSVTAALPVTVIDAKDIDATGAVSGAELFQSIPQFGDVEINATNNPQTSNSARGDVNSINLRNLGTGNTLVLLNGRRVLNWPASNNNTSAPVLSVNSNTVPVAGLERLEVLRDGAAAIYGTDAVAGVVNTILKSDFNGLTVETQVGGAEGTHRREMETNLFAGRDFADRRGNISLSANYTKRTAQLPGDESYTASGDRRALFADLDGYNTSLAPDGRVTQTPWGSFTILGLSGTIRQGTTAVTSAAGAFHVQPNTLPNCTTQLGNGLCLGNGAISTSGAFRDIRYDGARDTYSSPRIERVNAFLSGHYDLTEAVTAYGEIGYFHTDSHTQALPDFALSRITIPASNYYNPFGPVTFADGRTNPNRLAGLTNVPVTGLNVQLGTYRFIDLGPRQVDNTGWQARFLGGLKGEFGGFMRGFSFDSALVYSKAHTTDTSDGVDRTRLQQRLALSTSDAYNPFNGGCLTNFSIGDCTPSSRATLDNILIRITRRDTSTLLLGDFKLSNARLFSLPGGDLGIAAGVEVRRETQFDDRDDNVDGTITFADSVYPATTDTPLSNVTGVSPSPDTYGKRTVASAFAELAIPIISPEMNVPLVRRLEAQVAGRYEHYSDFGSVSKPKVAAAWDVIDGIRFRGSYSEGFRAPNLEQSNVTAYGRAAGDNDYYACEADLRARRITTFNACGRGVGFSAIFQGNPDLKPETNSSWTVGTVLQPKFMPSEYGRITLTADLWQIKQKGIVGIFGSGSEIILDYLLRQQGSFNPNVVRNPVTADDIAAYAGTGLAAAGTIRSVTNRFVNLLPQEVRGLDLGFLYRVRDTIAGDFDIKFNGARLLKFSQELSPQLEQLVEARAAGQINAATPLGDAQDLLGRGGKPKWRATATVTWTAGPVQTGLFLNYIGTVYDYGFVSTTGDPYQVKGRTFTNLYVQYTFKERALDGLRLRVGARNIFDKDPGISAGGYFGSLYQPYGRYWYASLSTKF